MSGYPLREGDYLTSSQPDESAPRRQASIPTYTSELGSNASMVETGGLELTLSFIPRVSRRPVYIPTYYVCRYIHTT